MLRINLRLERDYEPGLHDMLAALPPRLRAEVVRKLLAQAWLMGRLRPGPATAGAAAPVEAAPPDADWDGLVAERLGDAVL